MPQGKSPQEVMTPAVADPSKLGYLKLYKMMLDMVSCNTTCEQSLVFAVFSGSSRTHSVWITCLPMRVCWHLRLLSASCAAVYAADRASAAGICIRREPASHCALHPWCATIVFTNVFSGCTVTVPAAPPSMSHTPVHRHGAFCHVA